MTFLGLNWALNHRLHGEALSWHRILSKKGVNGRWVMGNQLGFGLINGLMIRLIYKCCPSQAPSLLNLWYMSVLIDPQTIAWREELVRRIFILADVHSILSIPLSSRLPHDRLVSAYTPKGRFTVQSAYKLVVTKFLAEIIKSFV